ncbi:MAG: lipid-A-disaccharide synthase [Planctomycetota bacterium]
MAPKIVLLAGEESGDGHGARLVTALRRLAPGVEIHGMGGPRMAAAGMQLIRSFDGMQIMGFWEVLKNLALVRRVFGEVETAIRGLKPDLVCGIDYPGFNLRMEKRCKGLGMRTAHYIAPQVWAWKKGRARRMAQYVDLLIPIFDFEAPFFTPHGLRTEFVGHPLIEGYDRAALWARANDLAERLGLSAAKWSGPEAMVGEQRPVQPLVVLPGSRRQVLEHHLERFVRAAEQARLGLGRSADQMPILLARPAGAAALPIWRSVEGRVRFVEGNLQEAVFLGQAALTSSGTATLEAGLTGTPMTVAYVGGRLSAGVAHLVVDIPVISLVNIVLGGYLVEEFLQGEASVGRLAGELKRLCSDRPVRERMHARLLTLAARLGFQSVAASGEARGASGAGLAPSERAAAALLRCAGWTAPPEGNSSNSESVAAVADNPGASVASGNGARAE